MATSSRATRAVLFMRRCRQSHPFYPVHTTTRSASDASQFAPSNFKKTLPSTHSQTSASTSRPSSSSSTSVWDRPVLRPAPWHHRPARSVDLPPPNSKYTAGSWFRSLFGRQPKRPPADPLPFHIHNNPYRARKQWPPDFSKLHPKQQFHFEKTYRRRAKLKWARPNWNRWTKLIQNTLIVTTLIYFVFIAEPMHGEGTPFDGFRAWFFGKMRNLTGLSEDSQEEIKVLEEEAREQAKVKRTLWQYLKERYPG